MKKILIAVDLQNDFVSGALGTAEAEAIVPRAAEKIRRHEGPVLVTMDTHGEDYLSTAEGKKLPVVHCVRGTPGWELDERIREALAGKDAVILEKPTFGSTGLPEAVIRAAAGEDFTLEIFGLCTDICVVSNALLLKAFFPETPVALDAAASAGVTPALHEAAVRTMRSCQIDIRNA